MREIKFRAWDKLEKRMRILQNGHDSLWFGRGYATYSNLQNGSGGEEYEIMQFTGLKDKNGKEIYEGDECNVLFASGDHHRARIVFIDGCFELNFYYPVVIGGRGGYADRDYLKCSTVNHAVTVIGNSHENPELLTGEAK